VENRHEGVYQGFTATDERQRVVRRLVLEFAGVELSITPTQNPGDFMKHIGLKFTSEEQRQAFITRMLWFGQQEQARRGNPPIR
jgi:hypothetical protein